MNLLDENIREDQRILLHRQGVPFRQIGKEISESGIADDNIIPLLHRLGGTTFFTQDEDFFRRALCHNSYALVYLDVRDLEVAEFIRRFLKHSSFRTKRKRMGVVARLRTSQIHIWRKQSSHLKRLVWKA